MDDVVSPHTLSHEKGDEREEREESNRVRRPHLPPSMLLSRSAVGSLLGIGKVWQGLGGAGIV